MQIGVVRNPKSIILWSGDLHHLVLLMLAQGIILNQKSFPVQSERVNVESNHTENVTVVANVKRVKGSSMSKSMMTGIYGMFALRLARTLAMVYLAYYVLRVM